MPVDPIVTRSTAVLLRPDAASLGPIIIGALLAQPAAAAPTSIPTPCTNWRRVGPTGGTDGRGVPHGYVRWRCMIASGSGW